MYFVGEVAPFLGGSFFKRFYCCISSYPSLPWSWLIHTVKEKPLLERGGRFAAAMLMEEFWKRRAEVVVPGRPCVALMPGPKLPERDARSKPSGDVEPKGQVLSHCSCTQFGSREAEATVVKAQ